MKDEKLSMVDFLKTYTAIPVKFINSYYEFYKMCETRKHGINIDDVIKYLDLKSRRMFVETLKKSYTINLDYVILKINNVKSMKNVNTVYYYITFDCFERICMMSRSEKGNEVRDYFIVLRKFINYYREHFAKKINSLVKSGKGIYILLVNKNKNILKIGRTKNMRKRLNAYFTGKDTHPDIKFIMYIEDPVKVEKCVKDFAKIKKAKGNKELYKTSVDTMRKLIFNCADFDMTMKDIVNINDNYKKYDPYIIFDDEEHIEYINIKGDTIGYEKIDKED